MAYKDLRTFLDELYRQGQLLKINESVSPEPDLGAAGCAASRLGEQAPALLFNNIQGYENEQIAMNVHGSWPNFALAMGMDKNTKIKDMFFKFVESYSQYDQGEVVYKDNPNWSDCVIEEDINLFDILPLFRTNKGDGGFYIDKSVIISRDPEDPENFDKQNVGMYRLQVKNKSRIGIQPVPAHDVALHLQKAEALDEKLPIAICISNDPMIGVVACMPIKYDQSEYQMAAALQNSPYPITKAQATGLDVPWSSEYILEGHIVPRLRECEGPFGEFTGHYSGTRRMPVVEITKVSHRKKPIYEHLYIGMPWTEADYMFLNTCPPIYMQLKEKFPEVHAVNALYTHGLVVIVSTKCRYGGFGKAVGLSVLSTPHGLGYAKVVIVVDETVDPFNLPQVMWSLSTKFNPQFDLVNIPRLSVLELDPGSDPAGITGKVVLDATTPLSPETHGHYSQSVKDPDDTETWINKLRTYLD